MSVRTLAYDTPMETVFVEIVYPHTTLFANPLTRHLAPPFKQMRDEFFELDKKDYLLIEQKWIGVALCQVVDTDLDAFVDQAHHIILLLCGKRTAPLYQQFFRGRRASELKKPVLGDELAFVRNWVGSLEGAEHEDLQNLADPLQKIVTRADEAIETRTEADQKYIDFKRTGDRRKFIDRLNALRKETYGVLSKLPHERSELKLPGDFADQFFRHETRSKPTTSADVQGRIDLLEAQIAEQRIVLQAMKEQEAAVAKAEETTTQAVKQAELGAARRAAEEAAKRVAELEAELK